MQKAASGAQGYIFDIQRFSLNDGPGIRTVVFFKGCPLSCWWCSNPESQKRKPVVFFNKAACTGCRRCEEVCTKKAITFTEKGERLFSLDKCTGCGTCAEVCTAGALILKGYKVTLEALMDLLKKDRSTFRYSGGGVTLSGGDPLVQGKFALEVLKACKGQGWNTALETEGCVSTEVFLQARPYVDHLLLDIKHMDGEKHRLFTGVSNEQILENAARAGKAGPFTVRVPVIPKFNHTKEEISAIAKFAADIGNVKCFHLLPYHTLGENKYRMLGLEYKMKRLSVKSLTNEDLEPYRAIVEAYGLKCRIGDED